MTEGKERSDSKKLGVSRRDVMKAAGGAIVAGGVTNATAGVAAAQNYHCFDPNNCAIAIKSDEASTIPSGVSFGSSGSQGTVTINTSTNPDLAGYQACLYIKGGGGSGPSFCGEAVCKTTTCNATTTITASTAQGDFSHAELCLTANPQVNFTDSCPDVTVTTNVCDATYTVTYDSGQTGCGSTSGTITGGSGTINVGPCSGTITVTALGQEFTHTFDCVPSNGGGGGGGGGNLNPPQAISWIAFCGCSSFEIDCVVLDEDGEVGDVNFTSTDCTDVYYKAGNTIYDASGEPVSSNNSDSRDPCGILAGTGGTKIEAEQLLSQYRDCEAE